MKISTLERLKQFDAGLVGNLEWTNQVRGDHYQSLQHVTGDQTDAFLRFIAKKFEARCHNYKCGRADSWENARIKWSEYLQKDFETDCGQFPWARRKWMPILRQKKPARNLVGPFKYLLEDMLMLIFFPIQEGYGTIDDARGLIGSDAALRKIVPSEFDAAYDDYLLVMVQRQERKEMDAAAQRAEAEAKRAAKGPKRRKGTRRGAAKTAVPSGRGNARSRA